MPWGPLLRGAIAAAVVVAVSEVGRRSPRLGALLLTLPVVSVVAFVAAYTKDGDAVAIARLARETSVLVPLGLPFFVPLAFAGRIGFWPAFAAGLALASMSIGVWFQFGSRLG